MLCGVFQIEKKNEHDIIQLFPRDFRLKNFIRFKISYNILGLSINQLENF